MPNVTWNAIALVPKDDHGSREHLKRSAGTKINPFVEDQTEAVLVAADLDVTAD